MSFLTNDKLVIVGAGGMIGSNMVQSALMLGLTPNICLYDIFEPGVHGVYDEMQQCAFPVPTSLTLLTPRKLSPVPSTSSLQVVHPVRKA